MCGLFVWFVSLFVFSVLGESMKKRRERKKSSPPGIRVEVIDSVFKVKGLTEVRGILDDGEGG